MYAEGEKKKKKKKKRKNKNKEFIGQMVRYYIVTAY